jgi:hypothetical protein
LGQLQLTILLLSPESSRLPPFTTVETFTSFDTHEIPTTMGGNHQHNHGDQPSLVGEHERENRPVCLQSTAQEILFVLSTTAALAQGSVFAGSTIGATAIIGHDLGMKVAEITWISAGFSSVAPKSPGRLCQN